MTYRARALRDVGRHRLATMTRRTPIAEAIETRAEETSFLLAEQHLS